MKRGQLGRLFALDNEQGQEILASNSRVLDVSPAVARHQEDVFEAVEEDDKIINDIARVLSESAPKVEDEEPAEPLSAWEEAAASLERAIAALRAGQLPTSVAEVMPQPEPAPQPQAFSPVSGPRPSLLPSFPRPNSAPSLRLLFPRPSRSREGSKSAMSLLIPKAEERASLLLRAVHGPRDFSQKEFTQARERILDAMATDIAARCGIAAPVDDAEPMTGLRSLFHGVVWTRQRYLIGGAAGLIAACFFLLFAPSVWQSLEERGYFAGPGPTQIAEVNTEQKTLTRSRARPQKLIMGPTKPQLRGQPTALGISLRDDAGPGSVVILGLPRGSLLSAGKSLGEDGWRVATSDLSRVLLTPPPEFTGTMELVVEFWRRDNTPADRKPLRLEWVKSEAQ